MSQTLEVPQPTEEGGFDEPLPEHIDREIQQFTYRPVPLLAIIGMALGILSVSSFLGVFGIVLALLGFITSLAATLKIAFDRTAYSGLKVASAGLILSTLCFGGGIYHQIYLYSREVPEGYQRVNFAYDISRYGIPIENGMLRVDEHVEALLEQPIFLKAWMFPLDEKKDLMTFLVVKDNGLCCFGKQPAPEDSIIVHVDPEKFPEGVDYTTGMVSMAGRLTLHPDPGGQLSTGMTIYLFEADYFDHSWTMF
jgi:hypothetical protein